MPGQRPIRCAFWLAPAALVLLCACVDDAGTPCVESYHCYSNSCTFGRCDSTLEAAIWSAITGEGDSTLYEWPEREPAFAPTKHTPPCLLLCEVLSEATCEQEPGCSIVRECDLPAKCKGADFDLACLTLTCSKAIDEARCEAPCELVPRCAGSRQCR